MIRFKATCIVAIALLGCGGVAGNKAVDSPPPTANQPASQPVTTGVVSLPTGVTLSYLEAGAPGGDVVLFLHGFTDTAQSFVPTIERLLELSPELHVYALDQRGHGQSSMPPAGDCAAAPERCFEVGDFAADAMAFLDARGVARASVVGHSMGSMIAQEMALDHPDRIERVVLLGTTANARDNALMRHYVIGQIIESMWRPALEARGERYPDDFYQLTPVDADPEAATWLAENWVTEPAADPAFLATIQPWTIKLGTWIGGAHGLMTFDTRERLQDLRVPVLVLWGIQDPIFPEEPDQRDLLAALEVAATRHQTPYRFKQYGVRPLPEDMKLDDISHNLQWGAAEPVAGDIAEFLRTGEPTGDRVYLDPDEPRTLRVDPGGAVIKKGPARAR